MHPRTGLLLTALLLTAARPAAAAEDVFEWFRCDSCRATAHQLNAAVRALSSVRPLYSVRAWEVEELAESLCGAGDGSDSSSSSSSASAASPPRGGWFSKDTYGVKQHEGRSYLFGPGITSHIGNEGFGQMGMGDYHERLASYCRHWVESWSEEEGDRDEGAGRRLDVGAIRGLSTAGDSVADVIHEPLACAEACADSSSGFGARAGGRRKRKQQQASSSSSTKGSCSAGGVCEAAEDDAEPELQVIPSKIEHARETARAAASLKSSSPSTTPSASTATTTTSGAPPSPLDLARFAKDPPLLKQAIGYLSLFEVRQLVQVAVDELAKRAGNS